jgi:phosphoglucomutase
LEPLKEIKLWKYPPLAGKPAPKNLLVDLSRLEREYFERQPDLLNPDQM